MCCALNESFIYLTLDYAQCLYAGAVPNKQQTWEDLIFLPLCKVSYREKGQINRHGQTGKKMLSCFPETVKSFSTGRFEFLKKWLLKNNCHCLWDQAVQTVSRERNRKKCKGLWVKHCHHQSLNHLWTIGFSGMLGASWGKVWACFRKNQFLSCCPGWSTVVWESGGLPVRRAVCSSSTDQLSDLESLKLCSLLVFLGEITQNKINIMELKTLRLFRTHCPQFERKRYQGK